MPYKFETAKLLINRKDDLRIRLSTEDREAIRLNKLGLSQRGLAAKYKVSRRLITFILDPDKAEANKLRRKERGGWAQYYSKEEQRISMQVYRRRKQKLNKEGKLYDPSEQP